MDKVSLNSTLSLTTTQPKMLANPRTRTTTLHTIPYYTPSPPPPHFSLFLNSTRPSKFTSLSLLLSSSRRRRRRKCSERFTVRALQNPQVSDSVTTDDYPCFPEPVSVKIPYGDRHILVETGHVGRQASGSVMVTDGETVVYTSVCLADVPSEPSDFFPLFVNYQERFSAAGRTSGGFFKREGRTKDHEVLICRLIDRPLRPTMLKGFYHETQILSWVVTFFFFHLLHSACFWASSRPRGALD